MLRSIEVGNRAKTHTLVITPEFFTYVRNIANQSWGAHIRLRFHPWIVQWIVVSSVRSTPIDCCCFDVDRVPILIPKKQLSTFDGKVLGYEMVVPGFLVVGFVSEKT